MRSSGFHGSPALRNKNRKAKCHPARKHHARGLCRPCYVIDYEKRYGKRDYEIFGEKQESLYQMAPLAGRHCTICGIDFNVNLKPLGSSRELCSYCETEMKRGANMRCDLMENKWGYATKLLKSSIT